MIGTLKPYYVEIKSSFELRNKVWICFLKTLKLLLLLEWQKTSQSLREEIFTVTFTTTVVGVAQQSEAPN